jgi:hypothetical protein
MAAAWAIWTSKKKSTKDCQGPGNFPGPFSLAPMPAPLGCADEAEHLALCQTAKRRGFVEIVLYNLMASLWNIAMVASAGRQRDDDAFAVGALTTAHVVKDCRQISARRCGWTGARATPPPRREE